MRRDDVNRRRAIRVIFPFTIHIKSSENSIVSVYTEDISEKGVKVSVKEDLGIYYVVDLEIYIKIEPIKCKGRVVWVTQRESEFLDNEVFFDTGIEFLDVNDEDVVIIQEALDKMLSEKNNRK